MTDINWMALMRRIRDKYENAMKDMSITYKLPWALYQVWKEEDAAARRHRREKKNAD